MSLYVYCHTVSKERSPSSFKAVVQTQTIGLKELKQRKGGSWIPHGGGYCRLGKDIDPSSNLEVQHAIEGSPRSAVSACRLHLPIGPLSSRGWWNPWYTKVVQHKAKMAERYDRGVRERVYEAGDLVMLYQKKSRKLEPR